MCVCVFVCAFAEKNSWDTSDHSRFPELAAFHAFRRCEARLLLWPAARPLAGTLGPLCSCVCGCSANALALTSGRVRRGRRTAGGRRARRAGVWGRPSWFAPGEPGHPWATPPLTGLGGGQSSLTRGDSSHPLRVQGQVPEGPMSRVPGVARASPRACRSPKEPPAGPGRTWKRQLWAP